MIKFHMIICRCSCGKSHLSNVAGADYDNVNLNNIPCPDCVEGMRKQERNYHETKRNSAKISCA